jgi:hypothetical protein
MTVEDLLPPLTETPEDARGQIPLDEADTVIYRLGLHALDVPELPRQIAVADVHVDFVTGPLRAQETRIRQRYGLPIVFDKAMRRIEVGAGELVAVLWIEETPVPEDLEAGFGRWRIRALAAAGMLAAVLDERVVGEELFEDAILLARGEFVGGADMRAQVRSYLPFDIKPPDLAVLDQLTQLQLSEADAAARAARLYRRAALEGPTADSFAMLWVAAECFSDQRTPSRPEIEQVLTEAGADLESLPIPVGRLIGLRASVVHHGREMDDELRMAYYEMEAVVRALIRQAADLKTGWFLAPENPAAFADPFPESVLPLFGRGTSEWHEEQLPPAVEPQAVGIPRRAVKALDDPRVTVDEAFGDQRELLAAVLLDAIEWQDPTASLELRVGAPDHAPADSPRGASATTIWFREEAVEAFTADEAALAGLVWEVHSLAGAAVAQRHGVPSEREGVAIVEAISAWFAYVRLIRYGGFEAEALEIPTEHDLLSAGKVAGWAAAGDPRAGAALEQMPTAERQLAHEIVEMLDELDLVPATWILEESD